MGLAEVASFLVGFLPVPVHCLPLPDVPLVSTSLPEGRPCIMIVNIKHYNLVLLAEAISSPSRDTQRKEITHLPVCNPIEGSIPSNVTEP